MVVRLPPKPRLPGIPADLTSAKSWQPPNAITLSNPRKKISSREDILKTLQKGIDLQRKGELRQAEYYYQLVLRDNPKHPDALGLMGVLAADGELFELSIEYLEKALKLRPDDPQLLNNLGNAYILADAPNNAIPHLKKSISISDEFFEASINLARAQSAVSLASEAIEGYRAALKKKPDHTPARIGLATAYRDAGQPDKAIEVLREVIKDKPREVMAYSVLVSVTKMKPDSPDIDGLINLLDDPTLADHERDYLHHAAGKMLNDLKRYDEAFEQFEAGKKSAGVTYDLDSFRKRIDSYIELFDSEFFQKHADYGSSDKRPVFIVGMPRSGTTLTEQIIAAHPEA